MFLIFDRMLHIGFALICSEHFNCMLYQLLRVQHSCSAKQSWGNVLPFNVEQKSRVPGVAPFSLRIGIWDFFVHREIKPLGICGHHIITWSSSRTSDLMNKGQRK